MNIWVAQCTDSVAFLQVLVASLIMYTFSWA